MNLTFYGAAGEVTGSRFLLDSGEKRILIDCGLFQGHRQEAREKNRRFDFKSKLDAVVLTHAHIDHTGTVPMLAKAGYLGPIYCTPATLSLCSIMLPDSGRLQEEDAYFFNRLHLGDGQRIEPMYTEEDARQVLGRFKTFEYDRPFAIGPALNITLQNAGHVLGSAMILANVLTPAGPRRVLFTGDLGRATSLLMTGPQIPRAIDYLIIESTYGSRVHDSVSDAAAALAEVIDLAVRDKGKILIPSFALERTQEIIFLIDKLRAERRIPPIPVYVDSPMAVSITEIFNRHLTDDYLDADFKKYLAHDTDPFGYAYVHYVRSPDDSKKLNALSGPMIIVAASGMCEGGRILHHLRHAIDNPTTRILLVGYQAAGTLGRRLAEGARRVRIFGYEHEVAAQVRKMSFFSAHADQADLLRFIEGLKPAPRKIFLVHGEPDDRQAFATLLATRGVRNVECPTYADRFELE